MKSMLEKSEIDVLPVLVTCTVSSVLVAAVMATLNVVLARSPAS